MKPNPNGDNVTLYRGTGGRGDKDNNIPLFMTDDSKVAQSYVKNGEAVIEVTMPRSTLNQMRTNGVFQTNTGYHTLGGTTTPSTEYIFHSPVKQQILNSSKLYVP